MRKIIVGLLFAAAQASAQGVDKATLERCQLFSELAGSVMQARQSGAEMSMLMDGTQNLEAGETLQHLIVFAYEQPRHPSGKAQLDAVLEFRNGAYFQCIKRGMSQ